MGTSLKKFRAGWELAGWLAVGLSYYLWIFAFYPTLGHDFAMGVPGMFELRQAWKVHGVLDIDFSPFRCLGLPLFSNPNSLVWSFYQLAAIVFESEIRAIFAVLLTFATLGYWGTLWLLKNWGVERRTRVFLALGWCVQGFCMTHILPGHTNYAQFAVFPWLLGLLLGRKLSWPHIFAAAFLMAHLLFTSGYYLLLVGIPSVAVAALIWQWLGAPQVENGNFGTTKHVLRNGAIAGALAIGMTLPKILGVLNFTALFPREVSLDHIGIGDALAYVAGNYFYPFPYDVRALTGWWYGNWESYEFLYPGLIYVLLYGAFRFTKRAPWKKAGLVFAGLLVAGVLLSSGVLAPIFESLPFFKSLHVNPRWNSFLMLPSLATVACLAAALLVTKKNQEPVKVPGMLLGVLSALCLLTPLLYLDRENMQINYPNRAGIDFGLERAQFCYEPIFGYGLESFPLGRQTNWLQDKLVDPRCYLKSGHCQPGAFLEANPEERKQLASYSLKDDYAPVKALKPWAFVLYLLGFVGLVWSFVSTARAAAGQDDRGR